MTASDLVLLDGATGTELTRRGVPTRLPAWSATAIESDPDVVRAIHLDHARAGADVLTANTFRTQRRTLVRIGHARRAREWTFAAVRLAREAAETAREEAPDRPPIRVAGSVAPLEDCYEPSLAPDEATALAEQREHAGTLAEAGVELLLVETMGTLREARAATRAATETGLETWTSAITDHSGTRLLSGERLEAWVEAMAPLAPAALLVNCVGPAVTEAAIRVLAPLAAALGVPCGAYANLGSAEPIDGWRFDIAMAPDEYATAMARVLDAGASIVGGCCGTTPEHIGALRRLLDLRIAAARTASEETDAPWRALVATATRLAGGGPALVVGRAEMSLPGSFQVTRVALDELSSLPEARFRLAIVDAAALDRSVAGALEPGGWLVARLAPSDRPLILDALEVREVGREGGGLRLLARRQA